MAKKPLELHKKLSKKLSDEKTQGTTSEALDHTRSIATWTTADIETCQTEADRCPSEYHKRLSKALIGVFKIGIATNETCRALEIDFRTI